VVVVRQVFRSGFWGGVAVVWAAFLAFNIWDVAQRSWPASGVVALLSLGVLSVLVFVVSVRPAVIADADGVEVRNPLRAIHVPWNKVTDIDSTDALRVHTDSAVYRSWAVSRGGAMSSVLRGFGSKAAGGTGLPADELAELARRSPADYAAATLTPLWREARKRSSGPVRVTWAWPEALVLVAFVIALVVASRSL